MTSAGLRFAHPVVLAAGFDKDAEAVSGFFGAGFAGVEVGTVTPRPQPGNPAPRLFRIPQARALINRMGFNNHGVDAMAARLRALGRRAGPVGVNLGKNKDTPLERAVDDYVAGVEGLGALADYVVVNASSPNTPGLRSLQQPEQLRALLGTVGARLQAVSPGKPLFLKIAPDLAPEEVDAIVEVAVEVGIAGLICTNTTLARPGVGGPVAAEAGGLSGAPLGPLALVRPPPPRRAPRPALCPGAGCALGHRQAHRGLRAAQRRSESPASSSAAAASRAGADGVSSSRTCSPAMADTPSGASGEGSRS